MWRFLDDKEQLPVSLYGKHKQSILEDEDLAQELHVHLQSLNMKYLHTLDIMDYMGQPDVMERLNLKKAPSECMAWQWMHVIRS